MAYVIEDDVPIPNGYKTRMASPETEAVRALKPGQSVVLPTEAGRKSTYYEFTRSKRMGKPKYFITRRVDNEHVRVWRILGAPEPSDKEGIL